LRKRGHIPTAVILIFVTAMFSPRFLWSWGPLAHRVTARMAENRLTPEAAAAVRELLGSQVKLADVASWADEQREIPNSASWHYVNVPISETRYDSRFCRPGGCVVGKIEEFKHVLQNPKANRKEKQAALKFLIHLIADVHQPLHVGDAGNRGGNDLQVLFYGESSNLHKVWDSQIIRHYTKNEQVWLWYLTREAKPEKVAEWSKGTAEDWATESLQAAKKAYLLPGTDAQIKPGAKLGDQYCRMALPIIQIQLAKAGTRIAWTLNTIFQ
jgi:hypothetical protein